MVLRQLLALSQGQLFYDAPPGGVLMSKQNFVNSNNTRLVLGLFIEWDNDRSNAVYTISRKDKIVDGTVYPSLYRLYMETGDITEAKFVENYLYDQEQWERLCGNAHLKDEIARWRQELRLRLQGQLVDQLMSDAFSGSKSSMSSAKYLLDHVVKPRRAGRPSKQEQNLQEDTKDRDNDIVADLERITNLKKQNGQS